MRLNRELHRRVFSVRTFALLSLVLFIFHLSFKPNFFPKSPAYGDYLSGAALRATVPPDFDFKSDEGRRDESFKGKIYALENNYRDHVYGTYAGGDDFTGVIRSEPFIINSDYIYVPVTGYPAKPGNSLSLKITGGGGETVVFAGENPGEVLKFWRIDSRNLKGAAALLEMSDQTKNIGGWLGAGKPLLTSEFLDPAFLDRDIKNKGRNYNYFYYYLCAAIVFALIFLPGLAVRRFFPSSVFGTPAFLPLPGFGLTVAFGLLLWLSELSAKFLLGRAYVVAMAVLALTLVFSKRPAGEIKINGGGRLAFFFYAALCLYGLQYLSVPAEVAQEIGAGTNMRSGMVASPPDHLIPYYTAAYFFHKKDGVEMRKEYFGDDWSVVSRGPLTALSINAAFNIFRIVPGDPPRSGDFIFPADGEGAFLARIVGISTNAFLILSAGHLALCLGAKRSQLLFCLAWLTLSPVVVINTTFLWPKLLATYFIVLALCEALTGRNYKRIGFWAALGYLSHPVGGLFAPCLILFWSHLQVNRRAAAGGENRIYTYVRSGAVLGATLVLWTLPWLIYKLVLKHKDVFLSYFIGDGRGVVVAESFSTWLACRWDNLVYTLVPAAFMFSGHMYSWLYGPLSEPLRWTVQYAKTLPAHLGFSLFALAYWLVIKPNRPSLALFRNYILGGNLLLMLLFWGYSSDGLGRNCLEPLSVVLIIYAASQITKFNRLLKAGLVLLAVEDFYLIFSGFFANPGFDVKTLSYSNWVQFFGISATLSVILGASLLLSSEKSLSEEPLKESIR